MYRCYHYDKCNTLSLEELIHHLTQDHPTENIQFWRREDGESIVFKNRLCTFSPDNISKEEKAIRVEDDKIVVCSISTTSPQKVLKKISRKMQVPKRHQRKES